MSLSPWTSGTQISSQDIITWEQVTAKHIRKHILRQEVEPELEDLQVGTNIVGPLPSSSRQRVLQEGTESEDSLVVRFDIAVSYRSFGTDHDIKKLIFSAWDTPVDRDEYIRDLAVEAQFSGIEDVQVEISGFVPPSPETKKKLNLAVIIGASVGGVALIFLVGFFFLKRGSEKFEEEHQQSATTPETASKIAVSTYVFPLMLHVHSYQSLQCFLSILSRMLPNQRNLG